MSRWFGPSGDCGCCGSCDCLDGLTQARQFSGTPTVKVVISDVLDEFEYQVTNFFSFPSAYRDSYKISGLSSIEGTYFFELTKTASGCIDLTNGSYESQTIGSATVEVTRQIINGSTCVEQGLATTTTELKDIELSVESLTDYEDPGPPPFICRHVLAKIFNTFSVAGIPNAIAAIAHTSTRCQENYIPAESTGLCHQYIYQFVNEGRIRTFQTFTGSTACGSTVQVDVDWGSFAVTIEDL